MNVARLTISLTAMMLTSGLAMAIENNVMTPRVTPEEIEAARALKNPLPQTPETIATGKTLYGGKGSCAICHGISGRGDGMGADILNPSPRNFHRPEFWRHRTDGELFWTIKHGSAGTGMVAFGGYLTDEEIWAIISYEHTFADGHGGEHGMGMGPGGMRPDGPMGPGSMGKEGTMGDMMRPHEGACCRMPEAMPKSESNP